MSLCWKKSLQDAFTSVEALLSYLNISHPCLKTLNKFKSLSMPLRVPKSFAERMNKGDRYDPLLLQVLPMLAEDNVDIHSYSHDPLQETYQMPKQGLIHKYHGRVLLIANSACAIHCRYCFRRDFDYNANIPDKLSWQDTFKYIEQDETINEVILSGGDPLLLSDKYLQFFINNITNISHIKRIRIHSRVPVVLPERITSELLNIISKHKLQTILVIHVNHKNELDKHIQKSLKYIGSRGITLLNQSTLLRNINDNSNTLAQLSERLFKCGVLPYYLHTLDKIKGAQHFYISDEQAWKIYQNLQEILPGFLVPKIVKEVPFHKNKILLTDYLSKAQSS